MRPVLLRLLCCLEGCAGASSPGSWGSGSLLGSEWFLWGHCGPDSFLPEAPSPSSLGGLWEGCALEAWPPRAVCWRGLCQPLVGGEVLTVPVLCPRPHVCAHQELTLVGHRQPCVRALSRMVSVWKPGCGRQAWCIGHERR